MRPPGEDEAGAFVDDGGAEFESAADVEGAAVVAGFEDEGMADIDGAADVGSDTTIAVGTMTEGEDEEAAVVSGFAEVAAGAEEEDASVVLGAAEDEEGAWEVLRAREDEERTSEVLGATADDERTSVVLGAADVTGDDEEASALLEVVEADEAGAEEGASELDGLLSEVDGVAEEAVFADRDEVVTEEGAAVLACAVYAAGELRIPAQRA